MADEITVISDDKKYKTLVTDIGHAKIANAVLNGEKVNITTAVIGDGGGADYKPTGDMTKIKNEVWHGEIANKSINQKSKNMFDIKVVLDGNVGGFTVREVGLLDEKGDLIVIANTPPIPKVVLTDGALVPLVIMLHVVFTNSAAVKFTVNPNLDAATYEDLAYAISVHTESEHPDTSFIQMEHHLGCRPQVMALSYQYGAGMGNGPAGGTNLMEIPTKVEYAGKDSLTIYTTKSAAKPGVDKSLHKISDTEYVITYQDNDKDAVYIRLIPEQKETTFTKIATIPHHMGVYPR